MKTLFRLSKMIKSLLPVLFLAVLLGTLGHFCAIGIPVLGAFALGNKLPLYILFILGILRGILHYAEQYCNHFLAFSVLARIREEVFQKLRSLGPAKMETKEKGSLISILTSDIELLEVFFAHTLSPVCIAILVTCGMLVLFGFIHPLMIPLALFFYLLVAFAVPAMVAKISVKLGMAHREKFASMNSYLLDSLRGLEQTILYGNGLNRLEKIKSGTKELSETKRKLSLVEGLTYALSGLFVTLAALCMLCLSLFLYKKGIISIEKVVLSVIAMFSSFGPLVSVAALGSGLSGTVASGKRVLALLDEEPLLDEVKDGVNVEFSGAEAKNVDFTYPSNPEEKILCHINMEFPKNSIIGIKGKSGSGKSTLIKLFMAFWKADSGKMEISHTDVNQINTQNLRDFEAYVTQETVLFHDTIANNLRIAKQDATLEELQEACRKAAIHDFIMELPEGYETLISELGDNFSGGERQRLGLARAFLHQGEFLLLDEPTSNLDSYNEHKIMEAVKNESEGKTVVIVSHRDSTFEYCNKIYALESGRQS